MGKCIYCNKRISMFGKDKLCDDCKDMLLELVEISNNEIESLNNQIDFNKSLTYNVTIYKEIIEKALKIKETSKIIPFIKSDSVDDLLNQIRNNIKKWCESRYIAVSLDDYLYIHQQLINASEILSKIDFKPLINKYKNKINELCCYEIQEDEKGLYTMWADKKIYFLRDNEYNFFNNSVKSLNFLFKDIPIDDLKNYRIKDIIGVPTLPSQSRCFSIVEKNLKTPTGKDAKFPTHLSFITNYTHNSFDDVFGDLFFYADGGLGKANITIWKDKKVYSIDIKVIDDMPCISKITKTNGNNREIIYKL